MVVQQIACVRLQWLVPVCILSSVLPVYVAEAPASPGIVLFGTRLHKRELERTMYPTIHSNSGVGSSTQYAGHSDPSSANGPLQLSRSISNSNTLPVLRVHVADHLSISPPVMTSTETGNIPRTDFSQNFDYEHQVLRDFAVDPQTPSSIERTDSSSLELQRYMQLGHDREAVAMALVAVTVSEDKDSEVLKFIEDFSNLKAMGFAPEVITGAMIAFPNDTEGATEACISCSS